MKKYFILAFIGIALIGAEYGFAETFEFHDYYRSIVIFFIAQTAILFRLGDLGNESVKVQMSMVKMGVRLISALVFVLVMAYQVEENSNLFFIQFIILYLVFMAFEIILALANLRRN
ncbi:MAG: hypothetical protein RIF46_12655 [Cyclobacteriaceae bacterium]